MQGGERWKMLKRVMMSPNQLPRKPPVPSAWKFVMTPWRLFPPLLRRGSYIYMHRNSHDSYKRIYLLERLRSVVTTIPVTAAAPAMMPIPTRQSQRRYSVLPPGAKRSEVTRRRKPHRYSHLLSLRCRSVYARIELACFPVHAVTAGLQNQPEPRERDTLVSTSKKSNR